jgi:hypothetical protein
LHFEKCKKWRAESNQRSCILNYNLARIFVFCCKSKDLEQRNQKLCIIDILLWQKHMEYRCRFFGFPTNVPKRFDSKCLGLLANTNGCNLHGVMGQLSPHQSTVDPRSLCKSMRGHQSGIRRFVLCWWP